MKEDRRLVWWRIGNYVVGAIWGLIGLWGIVSMLFLGSSAIISSVPLIFVASMWANMMMHFQKAQQERIERNANDSSSD